jgi:hypothetical protein
MPISKKKFSCKCRLGLRIHEYLIMSIDLSEITYSLKWPPHAWHAHVSEKVHQLGFSLPLLRPHCSVSIMEA